MKGAFREQILKPDYHDKNLRKLLSGEKFDKKESDSMVDDSDDYAMQMQQRLGPDRNMLKVKQSELNQNDYMMYELKYLEGVYRQMKHADESIQDGRRNELMRFLSYMNE